LMKIVRKPKLTEMVGVKKLLDAAAKNGDLLQRPLMELYETARDFFVYVDESGVAGCAALHIDNEDLAEIRSVAVRPDLRGNNVGSQLINACMAEARNLDLKRVYALTRVPLFFLKQGFNEIDKHELPQKVFQDCLRCPMWPDCDETAVLRHVKTDE